MDIGILCYSTNNIGDDIQSLALKYFLEGRGMSVRYYVDRDHCHLVYNQDFQRIDPNKLSSPINLYLNCWFTRGFKHFPYPEYIRPIFVSLHIPENYETKYKLVKNNIAYFKKYEPIGVRDHHTLKLFQQYQIKAKFIGCPTLTLDPANFGSKPKSSIPKLLVGSDFQNLKINQADYQCFDSRDRKYQKMSTKERFNATYEIISLYYHSPEVRTNRLHCYLPCYALGHPNVELVEVPM